MLFYTGSTMERTVRAMDRLTFGDNGSPAYRFKDCVYKNEIARKLYAYEDTGLIPEEIIALKADNKRLHELIDILEGAIKAL